MFAGNVLSTPPCWPGGFIETDPADWIRKCSFLLSDSFVRDQRTRIVSSSPRCYPLDMCVLWFRLKVAVKHTIIAMFFRGLIKQNVTFNHKRLMSRIHGVDELLWEFRTKSTTFWCWDLGFLRFLPVFFENIQKITINASILRSFRQISQKQLILCIRGSNKS